jgi:predicted enzyme related to lactoylglutathione lyase
VNDFHKWQAWSPWEKLDPAMKRTYAGAAGGAGAVYAWAGNNQVGEGRMTLTESRPGELIRITLEFVKPFRATNTAEFTFTPEGGQTTVAWSMAGRNNFAAKAIQLFEIVGGDGRPEMIKGLRGATIWSEDLNNLLPFYRDVLGLKVGLQIEGFAVLGDLGTPALALGTHSAVHGRNIDPARHMVGLATDDVDGDCKRLRGAGVEFVEDPTDCGTLRIATLKDPEGNLLQLLQPLR